jgi:hypothetical protein
MAAPRLNPEGLPPAPTSFGVAEAAPTAPPGASWFTPREVARQRRVRVSTIFGWIRRGELEAINHADTRLGKPRWKISTAALEAFDLARSSRPTIPPPRRRRSRGRGVVVTEYFE